MVFANWQDSGRGPASVPQQVSRPSVLVASRVFGASGQPWLWRQVVGFRELGRAVLCWDRQNPNTQPADGIPMHLLQGNTAPYDGGGRWIYRLRNLPKRNFYAACGDDRFQIANALRQEKPSVVLCYFGDIGMRLLPIVRLSGIPLVVYMHGDFLFVTNRWYRWSLLKCLRDFAAIIVVTNSERVWLREHGVPDEKVYLIPCGAPTEVFHPNDSHAPNTPVKFVMSSRLIAEKGCHLSVEAFAQLATDIKSVELHIYGDGPAREELQQLVAARNLQAKVFFYGYVDEKQLAKELRLHDVFIQHSLRKEGSPVSIVEAMASGLPVVATPVGGIAEQVLEGRTGFLIAEKDVNAMAAAMRRLADDIDLRRKFGLAGRERAVTFYDATLQTRQLEKTLLKISSLG